MIWTENKPEFKEECYFVTATKAGGVWYYGFWEIKSMFWDGAYYLGILNSDGEEWGEPDDLVADRYFILPKIDL